MSNQILNNHLSDRALRIIAVIGFVISGALGGALPLLISLL